MGNKVEKRLHAAVGELEKVDGGPRSFWHQYRGVTVKGGRPVSVFVLNDALTADLRGKKKGLGRRDTEDPNTWDAWLGAKRTLALMQRVNHPCLCRCIDHYVDEEAKGMFIVTEPLLPLLHVVKSICATEIISVMHDVLSALNALHQKSLSHNNFGPSAIYISMEPRFRGVLWGLQYSCELDDFADQKLVHNRSFRDDFSYTPEESGQIKVTYKGAETSCRDVFSVAMFLQELLTSPNKVAEAAAATPHYPPRSVITEALEWCYMCIKADAPERRSRNSLKGSLVLEHQVTTPPSRPLLGNLLALPLFTHCALLKITQGIDLAGQPQWGSAESREYFSNLARYVLCVPYDVLRAKLLPCFLTEPFWIQPHSSLFLSRLVDPPLPASSALLLVDDYHQVADFVQQSLLSRRRALRISVLQVIEPFLRSQRDEVLADDLLPEIAIGIGDELAEVVSWSIHGILAVVRRLLSNNTDRLSQEAAIAFLNEKVNSQLIQRTVSTSSPAPIRSATLLGYVQLATLDHRIDSSRLPAVLSHCLHSDDPELVHHALNAVILAEGSFPLRVLALEFLSLIGPLCLHSSTKVKEKAHSAMALLLQTLEDGAAVCGEDELEKFSTPPLMLGVAVQQLGGEERKRKKSRDKDEPQLHGPGPPVLEEGGLPEQPVTELCDEVWDAPPGILSAEHIAEEIAPSGVPRRLITVRTVLREAGISSVEDTASVGVGSHESASPTKSKKRKKPLKKKPPPERVQQPPADNVVLQADDGASPEEKALQTWEKKTFDEDGSPFSANLARSGHLAEGDVSLVTDPPAVTLSPSRGSLDTDMIDTNPTPPDSDQDTATVSPQGDHLALFGLSKGRAPITTKARRRRGKAGSPKSETQFSDTMSTDVFSSSHRHLDATHSEPASPSTPCAPLDSPPAPTGPTGKQRRRRKGGPPRVAEGGEPPAVPSEGAVQDMMGLAELYIPKGHERLTQSDQPGESIATFDLDTLMGGPLPVQRSSLTASTADPPSSTASPTGTRVEQPPAATDSIDIDALLDEYAPDGPTVCTNGNGAPHAPVPETSHDSTEVPQEQRAEGGVSDPESNSVPAPIAGKPRGKVKKKMRGKAKPKAAESTVLEEEGA